MENKPELTDEEKLEILKNFAAKLVKNSIPLEKEFADIINECYWELI